MSRLFSFKHFNVDDSGAAMKVGTDAVLLGCICQSEQPKRALDIGTGSGIVALMLAQRFQRCKIDALELDESATFQARENFANSLWSARLQAIHADVRHWQGSHKYDLIVCNPPFYPHSYPAKGDKRQFARSQHTLSYPELARVMAASLQALGSAWCVLPTSYETNWEDALNAAGLTVFSKTYVKPSTHKAPNRVIVGATKEHLPASTQQLVIREAAGKYTADYLTLTRDFYLFA